MNSTHRVPSEHDETAGPGLPVCAWTWVPRHWQVTCLFVLGCMVLVLILLAIPSHGQISPGPLSKPHHSMDGPTGCVRCHEVSPGAPVFRCLECHQEIAARLQQKRGLHPFFMEEAKASCVHCHSEHNGSQFALIRFDARPTTFQHANTGFALDGKHSGLACAKCHNTARIDPAQRASIQIKDANRSYLGLNKTCASCHEDKHKGQLGSKCQQCHNANDWKDARDFDHSKTRFTLTGAHRQVSCKQCHTPGGDGVMKYTGLKFERCASCHNDPHGGEFRQSCESCHNTVTWKRTAFLSEFDHSKTRYPLQGKHLEVSCLACHRGGNFKSAVAHNDCRDCHRPDPHGGQFLARADGGRCESCHSVQGFRPAHYTAADHKKTGFELQGKHAELQCATCHVPAGRATVFKIKLTSCISCHQDVHKGQFGRAPYFNRCEQCHSQVTFHDGGFDLARHQKTRFVLTGGHLAVACNDCHKPAMVESKAPAFHFENLSCTTCHTDPHRNQFAARMQAVDSSGRAAGCEACHSSKSWRDVGRFDHDTTKFRLTGTHRAVECAGCHRPPNLEHRLTNVNFQSAPTQCEECHENVHGPQFAKGDTVTRCAECHQSAKWRPSFIDHEKTAFSLKGAHQNVRCGACHKQLQKVEGRLVLVYKPTPTQCAACHGNSVAGGTKDLGDRKQTKL